MRIESEDRRDMARKEHAGNRQHQPEYTAEYERRDGDASGLYFVIASPCTRNERSGTRTNRHHHGLQREEHALSRADCGKRFGTQLPDHFRLHETDDAVKQVAENRGQSELQDARTLVHYCGPRLFYRRHLGPLSDCC